MNARRQRKAAAKDERIYRELKATYYGTALIDLSGLSFDGAHFATPMPAVQFTKAKDVKRLVNSFESGGCYRLPDTHHVSALISATDLAQALVQSNLSLDALRSDNLPPKLIVAQPLTCFDGIHRLKAAKQTAQRGQDWWVVKLYSDEASIELQAHVRQANKNATRFCDGEILCSILFYQECHDELSEGIWWAFLSRDKRRDLRRMLAVKGFRDLFNDLRKVPGLWPSFQIGPFRRYCQLNCHEQLLCYLRNIHNTFCSRISNGDRGIMQCIDPTTVEKIQSRAPRASMEDASFIVRGIESRLLFPLIQDPATREIVKQNVLSLPNLILSFYTFCEDSKFLEPPANVMKLLVDLRSRETVDQAFRRIYTRPAECEPGRFPQEISEQDSVDVQGDEASRCRHGLLQLWAKSMRSFDQAVNVACRKDEDETKPSVTEPNSVILYQFATLATKQGFKSDKIKHLLSTDPQLQEMRLCLSRLEPGDESNEALFTSDAQEHIRLWHQQKRRMSGTTSAATRPALVSEFVDQPLAKRCGRPFNAAHKLDKKYLFLGWIYDATEVRGRYITSFFVKQAIFKAFFGEESPTGLELSPHHPITERTTALPFTELDGGRNESDHAMSMVPWDGQVNRPTTPPLNESGRIQAEHATAIVPVVSPAPSHATEYGILMEYNSERPGEVPRKVVFRLEEDNVQSFEVEFKEDAVTDAARLFARHGFKLIYKEAGRSIIPPEATFRALRSCDTREIFCSFETHGPSGALSAFGAAIHEIERL